MARIGLPPLVKEALETKQWEAWSEVEAEQLLRSRKIMVVCPRGMLLLDARRGSPTQVSFDEQPHLRRSLKRYVESLIKKSPLVAQALPPSSYAGFHAKVTANHATEEQLRGMVFEEEKWDTVVTLGESRIGGPEEETFVVFASPRS